MSVSNEGIGITLSQDSNNNNNNNDDDEDDSKPNPEEYKIHMRSVKASEDSGYRNNDFVGSSNNTGRIKLQKKKWTPSKPAEGENAFRAEDWMGSGKTSKRSWKVKSKSVNDIGVGISKSLQEDHDDADADADAAAAPPTQFARAESEQAHKWRPTRTSLSNDHSASHSTPAPIPEPEVEEEPEDEPEIEPEPQPEPQPEMAVASKHDESAVGSEDDYEVASSDEEDLDIAASPEKVETPPVPTTIEHVSPAAPVVEPVTSGSGGIGLTVSDDNDNADDDDDDKPNPEEYKIHMRTVHASEDSAYRHNDFVGASNNTGRLKLEKKRWTPAKPADGDNAFRNDDWMGSGKTVRRSWKVKPKSKSVAHIETGTDFSDEMAAALPTNFVRAESEQVGRRWTPPAKSQAIPPPWMAGADSNTAAKRSSSHKWKPKTTPTPVNAGGTKDHHSDDLTLTDLQNSSHSTIKDRIEKLSESMSSLGRVSSHVEKAWQSHGSLEFKHSTDAEETSKPQVEPEVEFAEEVAEPEPNEESTPEVATTEPSVEQAPPTQPPQPVTSGSGGLGVTVGEYDDDDRPNPEEYKIHMRTIQAGEDSGYRPNDYVGSSDNTGRIKLNKKKWTPSKPDAGENAFRNDDWMGSGMTKKKSYRVKN